MNSLSATPLKSKLRVKVVSDQHIEFRLIGGAYLKYFNRIHPPTGVRADLCIVAGDLDTIRPRSRMFFQLLCEREKQVIYVPGNHEYYAAKSMVAVDDMLRTIEDELSNLKVLRTGEVFSYCGTRYLGDTMWVPRNHALIASAEQMNDPKQVPRLLDEIQGRHANFVEWLSRELCPGDIVVTHHSPTDRSIPLQHRYSGTEPWYVALKAEALFERRPRAWIHGHIHSRCDYSLHETRVVCNPLGYPNEVSSLPGKVAPAVFDL